MGKHGKNGKTARLKRIPLEEDDQDDLERCRRVRSEIDSEFATLDAMFDFFVKLDRKRTRKGKASKPKRRARTNSQTDSGATKRKSAKG
jgi:hypothetical protein